MPARFELTLPVTYLEMGFFNVPVRFDSAVRSSSGPVQLRLEPEGKSFEAHVNRTANTNRTPRIMGGVILRDWFQLHFKVGSTVFIRFDSHANITLSTRPN